MERFGYIDPFTGSLVLQVIAMAFFSVMIFFRKVKTFVLGFFGFRKSSKAEVLDESADVIKMETVNENKRNAA